MTTKSGNTNINSWGDDNPEKLNKNLKSPAIAKQLGDLISPAKMLDSIFAGHKKPDNLAPYQEKPKIKRRETLLFSRENRSQDMQLHKETEAIMTTLKEQITLLQKSEKALTKEISKVKTENLPPKTGIYYLRYFEWLLSIVKNLRLKIDEGRAWLSTFNNRKKKKLGYWQKYKKHGTTFGLSHERNLATQTG